MWSLYLPTESNLYEAIWLVVLCMFLAVQGWFLVYWFALPKLNKNHIPISLKPPVSVIVCSRNQPEQLAALLHALLVQQYPVYEIIIADDRSDDPQYDMLLAFEAQYPAQIKLLRIHSTPEFANEKKYAQTLAIKAARYEWLLCIDGDCLPAGPFWIDAMAQYFRPNTEIVLGFGAYNTDKTVLNKIIQYETLLTAIQYLAAAAHGYAYMGVGRNLAYRKSLFMGLKGHYMHIKKVGGDDDLFVGHAANHHNTAIAIDWAGFSFSIPKTNWQSWYAQKRRHLNVGKYYSFNKKILPTLYAFSHGCSWALILIALFADSHSWQPALILLCVFCVLQGWVFFRWAALLNISLAWWLLPFLSLFQCLYYLLVVVPALFTKKISWK